MRVRVCDTSGLVVHPTCRFPPPHAEEVVMVLLLKIQKVLVVEDGRRIPAAPAMACVLEIAPIVASR
jgi:hypothetical protein